MVDHPRFAANYDRVTESLETGVLAEMRSRLLARAAGEVLEVGAGTGRNLAYYPAGVTSITALEPDPTMREQLANRLGDAPVPVSVVDAAIDDAGVPPGPYDTVVATLVLCSVPDLAAAAGRIRRLMRPGATLLYLEHTWVPGRRGHVQRAATPVWRRMAGGCHLDRDVNAGLRSAGFVISACTRHPVGRRDWILGMFVEGQARLMQARPLGPQRQVRRQVAG